MTRRGNEPFASVVSYDAAGSDKFDELLCASRFAKHVELRSQGDRWFVWDGLAWRPRQRDCYRSIALNILPRQNRYARHAKSVIDHAEMQGQLGPDEQLRGAVAFDSEECVFVNVQNGLLRVTKDTVVLQKHEKQRLFTGCLAASWNAEALAENFFRVTMEALPADPDGGWHDLALLQWFAGYLLYPDCKRNEVFLICCGPGGTGKSTVAQGIMSVLGEEPLVTSLSMAQICAGERAYSLPQMEQALVNLGTELDTVEVDDSANFKKLVSGEVIEARTIYGRPFPMRTTAKLWFNANDLPRFKHGTDAEQRRARFLCFDRKPEVKDGSLKDLVACERDGVLVWMVKGLQKILAGEPCPEGGAKSSEVKSQFSVSNDPVRTFFDENLERDPDGWELKAEMLERFKEFMDHRGFPSRATDSLFSALYRRFPFIQPKKISEGGERRPVLAGVKFKQP